MLQVLLLRHAKSSWDDEAADDYDRRLSGRGRKNARALAKYLQASGFHPAMVLCSAATRTRETFAILESSLEGIPVSFEAELYEATKHDLLTRLRRLDSHLESVLLIGHNPGLERLAAALCNGHGHPIALARMTEKFPTGTLAVLNADMADWAALEDGSCRLAEFVRPADLD